MIEFCLHFVSSIKHADSLILDQAMIIKGQHRKDYRAQKNYRYEFWVIMTHATAQILMTHDQ